MYLLAAFPEGPRTCYVVYEQVSIPISTGDDGVPFDELERLAGEREVDRASRILPEQAEAILGGSSSADMGYDQEDDPEFILAGLRIEERTRYVLFKRVPTPVDAGEGGVPAAALDLLLSESVVERAGRLSLDKADRLLDLAQMRALGQDNPGDG